MGVTLRVWHFATSVLLVFSGCSCGNESPPAGPDGSMRDASGDDGGTANPPRVTTDQLPRGKVQVAYDQTLAATGGMTPYTWSVSAGTLPAGLALSADGHLSGTPSAAGSSSFTVRVRDAKQATGEASLTIAIDPPDAPALSVSTTALPTATIGAPYTAAIAVSGGTAPYTWTISSGSLPPGISLASATGNLSGAPTGTAQLYTFNVTVTDAASPPQSASASLGITVVAHSGALQIDTAALPGGEVGQPYSASLSATGGTTPYSWNIASGALPAGLSLAMASGQISGTPTSTGSVTFTARVTDAAATPESAEQVFTVVIRPAALTITTVALPTGEVGEAYSAAVGVSGGAPPYVFTLAQGSLPDGLSLDGATGVISGVPTTAGTTSVRIRVGDSFTPQSSAEQDFSVEIVAATPTLLVGTTTLPDAVLGSNYQTLLSAIGGTTPYTWSIAQGALPPGIALDADGTLHGTATSSGPFSFRAQVADVSAPSMQATVDLSLRVFAPLAIAATVLPGGLLNTAYSVSLTASGGAPPYAFAIASGGLPPGLIIDPATGAISGTPTQTGIFGFEVSATDAANPVNSATITLSITITAPLTISTQSLPDGLLGAGYSAMILASGGTPSYTFSISAGALPAGLSINATTGEISGTVAAAGPFSFTVQVSDTSAPQQVVTQALTIQVTTPPQLTIVTSSLLGGVTGLGYSESVSAVGGIAPYVWSITAGQLPAGLALDPSSGVILGTPTGAANETFTVEVVDAAAPQNSASAMFTIAITDLLTITTTDLQNGVTGAAYAANLLASGGTPGYTWTITNGGLPSGLALDRNTGAISGSPTESGVFGITLRVVDSSNPQQAATTSLSLTVIPALVITTGSLPNGTDGVPYASSAAVAGGTAPYVWSLSAGALPPGLSLNASDGAISGTPTTTGVYSFTVSVTDASSPSIQSTSQAYQVAINGAGTLNISTTTLPPVLIGTAYSAQLSATGGTQPYTWSISASSLPPGLSLDPASGVLSGLPSATGTYSFRVEVSDTTSPAQTAVVDLQIIITDPLVITTSGFNTAITGTPFSATLGATGGTSPYRWSLSSGALPPGLTINALNGIISGQPTTAGNYGFTVRATDSSIPALTTTANLSIRVTAPLTVTSLNLPRGTVGLPYSVQLTASGGIPAYSWAISGSLPDGLSLDPATGIISGNPSSAATTSFTAQVSDQSTPSQGASAMISIVISPPGSLVITTALLPDGVNQRPYSTTLSAGGGATPFVWSIQSGSLPAGVSLDPATGVISGTFIRPGSYTFVVRVADNSIPQQSATRSLGITVAALLGITSTGVPGGILGQGYSSALTGAGGLRPYTWSLASGSLPPGLTLDPSSGAITGIPSAIGSYDFVVQLADASLPQQQATRMFRINIARPLSVTTTTLPNGAQGAAYSTTVQATGGQAPYAWSLISGALPPGLSLSATSGTVSGTPTTAGTFNFTLRATDSGAPQQQATQALSIQILP